MKLTDCIRVLFFVLIVSLFSFCAAAEQEQIPVGGFSSEESSWEAPLSPKDQEIHDLVETLRETHLVQELQLPENKANDVIEKMRYSRQLRKGYLLERYIIENELDALLNYPSPDQMKINSVLQKLEIAKLHYYQQLIENDEELRQLLSPEEQAKYIVFQRNFNRKLKDMIASIRRQNIHPPTKQNQMLRKQATESVIRQPH